jgi:hypothetical protein
MYFIRGFFFLVYTRTIIILWFYGPYIMDQFTLISDIIICFNYFTIFVVYFTILMVYIY